MDFASLKAGKTVYIFESNGNVSTFSDKKLQKLKSLAINLSIYKKDGGIEMLPKNPKGKIEDICVYLLPHSGPIDTIITHREDSTFFLYMPKCNAAIYKELICKFKDCKLFIYGRDIIKVIKELIADSKIKKSDMITYLNYLNDFKMSKYKDICVWENGASDGDSYLSSSSDKSLNDLVLSVDKMLPSLR